MKMSVSQWKTRTKQNLNPNVADATKFIPKGGRPPVVSDPGPRDYAHGQCLTGYGVGHSPRPAPVVTTCSVLELLI
jgi:hypothetical protein